MTILALDNHNPPIFASFNILQKIRDATVSLLNIDIRHTNFVKVLYFIVGSNFFRFHGSKYSRPLLKIKSNMRQKHKSNVAGFHSAKGGAVPTLAHHRLEDN